METEFEKRLAALINEYSKENDSDTPDFILARYLNEVLKNFNAAVLDREQWYGRGKHIEDLNHIVPDDLNYKIPFEDDNKPDYSDLQPFCKPEQNKGNDLYIQGEMLSSSIEKVKKKYGLGERERNFSPELELLIDELELKGQKLLESIKKLKK